MTSEIAARVWIPTRDECALIRQQAQRESFPRLKAGNVILEAGIRCNTERGGVGHSLNILRVGRDDWEDTDLFDFASWGDFRMGVPLTDDGRADVDFYIRSRHEHPSGDSLFGNVVVEYRNGRIEAIQGFGGGAGYQAP